MVIQLLLLFLVAQEGSSPAVVPNATAAVDLRALVLPPALSVAETYAISESRNRTRSLPGATGDEQREVQSSRLAYTQNILQLDEGGYPSTVLLHITVAESTKAEQAKTLPHQGKYALYQREPDDSWRIATYVLENDERKDVSIPPGPLQALVPLFDNPRRNYDLLFAKLPEGQVQSGQTWPVEAKILTHTLEDMTGLDPDRSKLTLAVAEVTEATVTLALEGLLVLVNDKEDLKLVWEGQIKGHLKLARGPFQLLSHVIDVDETVNLTMADKSIQGKGKYHISREATRAK